jgi:hypothetical protein
MKAIYRDLMVGFAVLAMQNYALALTPEELTRALYIKLANSVMPNGNQLKIGRSYFIIANPGVIVGKPEDLGGEGSQQLLISQIDLASQKDSFYQPGLFHLANLYKATIDSMEVRKTWTM